MRQAATTAALAVLIALVALCVFLVAGHRKSGSRLTRPARAATAPLTQPQPPAMPVERIGKPPKNTGNARNADGEYLCPVLARPVTDFSPGNSFTYKGRAYFFGSPDCRVCFEADPERYIKAIKAGKVGGARVKLPESDGTE